MEFPRTNELGAADYCIAITVLFTRLALIDYPHYSCDLLRKNQCKGDPVRGLQSIPPLQMLPRGGAGTPEGERERSRTDGGRPTEASCSSGVAIDRCEQAALLCSPPGPSGGPDSLWQSLCVCCVNTFWFSPADALLPASFFSLYSFLVFVNGNSRDR